MEAKLSGKTALVTGAGKRLGRETALALAEAGANVVVHYRRSESEAREVAGQIGRLGVQAWTIQADLSSEKEAEGLVEGAGRVAGRLDILINNASIFPPGGFEDVSLDDLHKNIDVNAWVPFRLGRSFAGQADSGHIVNFLDTRVQGYDWQHVAYHTSKVLLGLFTRMMAIKFAPAVAVNAVAPGLILPPAGKDRSYLEKLKDTVPLKRVGNPRLIAEAVLFLVTSEFITGQVIFVDGGRHLRAL